jgi:serine/threonine-protein kinase HipA
MAQQLWGKVFYKDSYAGVLREEPGERCSFTYDPSYLQVNLPPLSFNLPLGNSPIFSLEGLHPFFDNLIAEGWLENAQMRLLGKRVLRRFELLLAFGFDCPGAVWVLDPSPQVISKKSINVNDQREIANVGTRASISGVQAKILVIKKGKIFYPCLEQELSTHIAKFPSLTHPDLIINEYLTLLAFRALLPHDLIVGCEIGKIAGIDEGALIIERFDRNGGERIHFEEFNQLLNKKSVEKYDGACEDLAEFLLRVQGGPPTELFLLFARILAGFLLGNTDMHLKNFALFPKGNSYTLTPSYDQVAACIYQYRSVALTLHGARDLDWGKLKAKHLMALAHAFQVSDAAVLMLIKQLEKNLPRAKEIVLKQVCAAAQLKEKIVQTMEARWNGTFALIGQQLSKKQS